MKIIFIIRDAILGKGISIMTVKTKNRRLDLSTIDNIKVETYNVNVGVTKYISKMTFDSALANLYRTKIHENKEVQNRNRSTTVLTEAIFHYVTSTNSRLVLFFNAQDKTYSQQYPTDNHQ